MRQQIKDGVLKLTVGPTDTAVCDFCSDPRIVKDYDCPDYLIPVTGPDGRTVELGSAGKWAACQQCAEIIDRGDKTTLMQRALQVFLLKQPSFIKDDPQVVEGTAKFLHDLHEKFWEGKRG